MMVSRWQLFQLQQLLLQVSCVHHGPLALSQRAGRAKLAFPPLLDVCQSIWHSCEFATVFTVPPRLLVLAEAIAPTESGGLHYVAGARRCYCRHILHICVYSLMLAELPGWNTRVTA